MTLNRRQFLQTLAGTAALGPLSACTHGPGSDEPPTSADAGCDPMAEVTTQAAFRFEHGVASGDPTESSVVLWTRITLEQTGDPCEQVMLELIVANDEACSDVVQALRGSARADRDFTVQLDVTGLADHRSYYYFFRDPARPQVTSEVGRTRTLPAEGLSALRVAVVACSCYSQGFFNSYRHIAERDDIDLVLHVGDYIYEYGRELYYDKALGRPPVPDHEIVTREDYRARHAQYRGDPDLRALHRRHPVITVWDDHEIANNASRSGADNHDEKTEGSYETRKRAALETYLEWLPVRVPDPDDPLRIYRSVRVGDLCDLIVLDTRTLRDRQDISRVDDPERSILGAAQADWLESELLESSSRGARFRIVVQQVLMLSLAKLTERNADTWDGYRASRTRFLEFLRDQRIPDVVVVSGDWHSSWAGELSPDPFATESSQNTPVAVEVHCPAVTSPLPAGLAKLWADSQNVAAHPHVRWVEMQHRGYIVLDIQPEKVQAEWCFAQTVKEPDATHEVGKAFVITRGSARLGEAG